MRNMVMILVSAILGGITVAIMMTVLGRMNHSVELQGNLSSVVENALVQMTESRNYQSEEEAIALCIKDMAVAMDTDAEVIVDVMEADMNRGILAVRVMEKFRHPNGNEGKTQWERIAIRNMVEEPQQEEHEVKFYLSKEEMEKGTECYKAYSVREGERILTPVNPGMEQREFACWKDINDYVADFSLPVLEDLCYYAQWE